MSHQNHVEVGNHSLGRKKQEMCLTRFIILTMLEEARRADRDRTTILPIVGGKIVYD